MLWSFLFRILSYPSETVRVNRLRLKKNHANHYKVLRSSQCHVKWILKHITLLNNVNKGGLNLDRFSFNRYSFQAWELTRSALIYSLKNRKLKIRELGSKSWHDKNVFVENRSLAILETLNRFMMDLSVQSVHFFPNELTQNYKDKKETTGMRKI